MKTQMILLSLFSLSMFTTAHGQEKSGTPTPEVQLKALIAEYEAAKLDYERASRLAKTKEERAALDNLPGRNRAGFAPRFLELAQEAPRTNAAEDALIWIGTYAPVGPIGEEARQLLMRDHIRSAKLAPVFSLQASLAFVKSVESLMRKALAENPHPDMQGMAAFCLGRVLKSRAAGARSPMKPDDLSKERLRQFDLTWGPGWKEVFLHADAGALEREAESLFIRVAKEYGDLPNPGLSKQKKPLLRDLVAPYIKEMQTLSVGETAPDVEGTDLDGKAFRLADYRGRVVMIEFGSHFFCGLCRELYPYEKEAVKKYEGKPFALVSIETGRDDDPQRNREALKKIREAEVLNWRCIWDGSGLGPLNTAWNVRTYPTTYLIDQAGVIRYRGIPGPKLDELVAQLLAEAENAKPAGK